MTSLININISGRVQECIALLLLKEFKYYNKTLFRSIEYIPKEHTINGIYNDEKFEIIIKLETICCSNTTIKEYIDYLFSNAIEIDNTNTPEDILEHNDNINTDNICDNVVDDIEIYNNNNNKHVYTMGTNSADNDVYNDTDENDNKRVKYLDHKACIGITDIIYNQPSSILPVSDSHLNINQNTTSINIEIMFSKRVPICNVITATGIRQEIIGSTIPNKPNYTLLKLLYDAINQNSTDWDILNLSSNNKFILDMFTKNFNIKDKEISTIFNDIKNIIHSRTIICTKS